MRLAHFYTKQMDAEGLGRKLLLTPSPATLEMPETQIVGPLNISRKMLTLQALSSSQNGRVHLHIIEHCRGHPRLACSTPASADPRPSWQFQSPTMLGTHAVGEDIAGAGNIGQVESAIQLCLELTQ